MTNENTADSVTINDTAYLTYNGVLEIAEKSRAGRRAVEDAARPSAARNVRMAAARHGGRSARLQRSRDGGRRLIQGDGRGPMLGVQR